MKIENKLKREVVNDFLDEYQSLFKNLKHCYFVIESEIGEPIKIGIKLHSIDRQACFESFSGEQNERAIKELKKWINKNGEPVYAKYGKDVISNCLQVGNDEMWCHERDGNDYFYQFALDEDGYIYRLMFNLEDIAAQYKEDEGEEWDYSLDTIDYNHPTKIDKLPNDDYMYSVLESAIVDDGFCDDLILEVLSQDEFYKKEVLEAKKFCKCLNACFAVMGNPILE